MLPSKTQSESPSEPESHPLQWHPASVGALKLELEEYKEHLSFKEEYNLTLKPLKIDIVVVKKKKNIPIEKNIAKIFRNENIIEYKSPSNYFAFPSLQAEGAAIHNEKIFCISVIASQRRSNP